MQQSIKQEVRGPRRSKFNWALFWFVLPGLVIYLLFLALPTLAALALSLTDWNGISYTFNFVGLENYTRVATDDPVFRQTIGNNLRFTLTVLICQAGLSLLLAILLVKNTTANIFYRALFFFPTVIASVSVALAWILMYDPSIGAVNLFLDRAGLGEYTRAWLGDRDIAIFSLSFVQFWQHTGQVMIIFIAGLQAIPNDLYDAAKVEGAGRWQTFRYVTWPLLAPAATIVVAYTTIQTFKAFDLVIALTNGGPAFATEILATWIYRSAFQNFDFGYASAGSVVFMLILALITWVQFRMLRTDQ